MQFPHNIIALAPMLLKLTDPESCRTTIVLLHVRARDPAIFSRDHHRGRLPEHIHTLVREDWRTRAQTGPCTQVQIERTSYKFEIFLSILLFTLAVHDAQYLSLQDWPHRCLRAIMICLAMVKLTWHTPFTAIVREQRRAIRAPLMYVFGMYCVVRMRYLGVDALVLEVLNRVDDGRGGEPSRILKCSVTLTLM